VEQRLGDEAIFEKNALSYAVKRILNLKGGDIRQVLDVIRKAILNK